MLAIAQGDDAAARRALEAAESEIAAAGGATHPQAFAVAMARGEALVAERRIDSAALAVADGALAAARQRALASERSSDIGRALLLRARLLVAAGRGDEARRAATDAHAQLAPTLGPTNPATRAAEAVAG